MLKDVFGARLPEKFDEVIRLIRKRYDARLLDENAGRIKKAIEDILQGKVESSKQ